MVLKVFNDLTKKLEVFKPLEEGKVRMYVCGPTIYDYAHLGHGYSAVAFDVIRRYLIWKGYKVVYVFNYTDIDDKMIERAKKEGITVKQLADKFEKIYDEEYKKLNVLPPDVKPKPTEHIKEIIELIKILEEKGYTYTIEDDGVYFDVSKFKDYGKLSKQKFSKQRQAVRARVSKEKRNPQDFVLWKFKKPGEPYWQSPWGEGRPGWHIECSAMSMKYLGKTLDIHGGGQDLIFPHHEDEIAQSEAATGKIFALYWLHNGFITINKQKMSKSLGNFFTLKEIFEKYNPRVVRFLFVSNHYRSPIEFNPEVLEQARQTLERIDNFIKTLSEVDGENIDIEEKLSKVRKKIIEAMDNDFNTARALAALFDFIRDVNKVINEGKLSKENAKKILEFLKDINNIFAIMDFSKEEIPKEIIELAEKRLKARKERNFELADKLREEIKARGYWIDDFKDGYRIRKLG